MHKSIEQINERIRDGSARVVTAEEMPGLVDELGEEGALKEVDVVTTGTFGAMCSSGAFLNFGHSEPPIRMERIWLNDVETYGGLAAVDTYIGATQQSDTLEEQYGGAHVLEDLVAGKSVELRATSRGTDCYPRRTITTELLMQPAKRRRRDTASVEPSTGVRKNHIWSCARHRFGGQRCRPGSIAWLQYHPMSERPRRRAAARSSRWPGGGR